MGIPKTSNEDTDKISNAIVKKISADNDIDQTDRSHRVGLKKGRGCAPNHRKVHIILCQGRTHIEQKEAIATVSGDKLFPFLNWPLRPAGWNNDRPFVHRIFISDDLTKARAAAAARARSLKKAGKIKDLWLRGEIVCQV